MKSITRMELRPGMVTAADVLSYKNELIVSANIKITDAIIEKLARHSILVVPIKEEIDFATTHFEKIRLSDGFKKFDENYQKLFPVYKTYMVNFVMNNVPINMDNLMKVYQNIIIYTSTGEQLLDYLYNMLPGNDDMTHAHCLNSALIAGVFGTWLALPTPDIALLIKCAFVYDIGKLWLPYNLLWKPGKLTPEEYYVVRQHATKGYEVLRELPWERHIARSALMHHERMDGTGYPSGISGEKIDLFARMIAIIDSYEAMTSYRVYRPLLNPFQVIANYEKEGFARFDASLIKPILSHIAQSQLGMNVHLSDGRNAEVILINDPSLSRPMVKELNSSTLIDLVKFPDITIDSVY